MIWTPSRFHMVSAAEAPFPTKIDCWPASLPATLTRSTTMPGTVFSTAHGSRPCGTCCSSSRLMVVEVPTRLVSTTGVSAVTVTVSSTVATFMPKVRLAFWPVATIDVAVHGGEAAEAHRELVGPGVEVQETEVALGSAGGGSGARVLALQGDAHSGQDGPGLVGHGAVDVAGAASGRRPWRPGTEGPRPARIGFALRRDSLCVLRRYRSAVRPTRGSSCQTTAWTPGRSSPGHR